MVLDHSTGYDKGICNMPHYVVVEVNELFFHRLQVP